MTPTRCARSGPWMFSFRLVVACGVLAWVGIALPATTVARQASATPPARGRTARTSPTRHRRRSAPRPTPRSSAQRSSCRGAIPRKPGATAPISSCRPGPRRSSVRGHRPRGEAGRHHGARRDQDGAVLRRPGLRDPSRQARRRLLHAGAGPHHVAGRAVAGVAHGRCAGPAPAASMRSSCRPWTWSWCGWATNAEQPQGRRR